MSGPRLFVRERFLSVDECRSIRAAMDAGRHDPAEIYDGGFVVDERTRCSVDVSIDDVTLATVESRLGDARGELSAFFGLPLVRNEGAGLLRYLTGGFYRAHHDAIGGAALPFARRVSVVVFLSEAVVAAHVVEGEYQGGALRLHDEGPSAPLDVRPSAGTLVAFMANTLHEVLPVTAGIRDVIVDWCS